MFDSVIAVPLHFTVEFLGFLVFGGTAGLVLARPVLVPAPLPDRTLAASGFVVLALVEMLHGAAFVSSDAGWVVAGGETIGCTLVLAGLGGTLEKRGVAKTGLVAPLAVDGSPALVPAAAALMTAIAAGAGARKGASTMWRLAASFFLLSLSNLTTALISGGVTIGVAPVRYSVLISHGIKALAFAALMWWVWSAIRSSIRTRFVAAFGALLVIVVLFLSAALTGVLSNNIEQDQRLRVTSEVLSARRSFLGTTPGSVRARLQSATTSVADLPQVRSRLNSGSALNRLANKLRLGHLIDADFLLFVGPDGRLLGASGYGPLADPSQARKRLSVDDADYLAASPVTRSANGAESSGVVRRGRSVAVMAATTVTAPGENRITGVAVAGSWLDSRVIESIQNNQPGRPTLLIGRRVISSALPGNPKRLAKQDNQVTNNGHRTSVTSGTDGTSYLTAFAPIQDLSGRAIATLALSVPASLVTDSEQDVIRALFLATMAVAVIALILAWLSGLRITRPIQRLTETAGAVREGDLAAKASVSGPDEIGQLGIAFNEMTSSLVRMTDDLRAAARQEEGLRHRIETIIESMADGLVAVDSGDTVLAFNRELELVSGLTKDEAIGKQLEQVLEIIDSDGTRIPLRLSSDTDAPLTGVFLARERGDPVPISITTAVLYDDDGEVGGGVAVVRDMTRDREIERMKSEFLSNISHELRTPLTPIKGFAQILSNRSLPPEKAEQFAKGVAQSAIRLERIVELLVDFAALEGGRLEPKQTPVDMGEIATALATEWSHRSDIHRIRTQIEAGDLNVLGDARLLRRSIDEVIDNAVKFSPDGGTVLIDVRPSVGIGPESVQVSVADEGIGIKAEDLSRIFSHFEQVDGSATRTYGGLGLGLSFVHRIIEAHNGRVRVDGNPGGGTIFTLIVPAPADGSPNAEGV